MAICLVIAIKF